LSEEPNAPARHAGLIYTVDLHAEHIIQAIDRATSYARAITDQLAAVHGTMIDNPVPQFSIDMAPEAERRGFAQIFYNMPILHEPRREYDQALYSDVFARLDQFRKVDPEHGQRIGHALHYLRNSYSEQDPVDRFEDAYVALEAIDRLIRKKHALTKSGIDYIITHLLRESSGVAKAVRDKRNDIVHARAKFTKVLKDIVPNTRVAQRAAIAGVFDLLGVPQEFRAIAARDFLPIAGPPRIIVQCTLYDLAVEQLLAQPKYPGLQLHPGEMAVPARPQSHAREAPPNAVQLLIDMTGYAGRWDLGEISLFFGVDPAQGVHAVELSAMKFRPGGTQPER
jgi:hypothetical protein